MDIREGGRRLVLVVSWLVAILIWIKGFFLSATIANGADDVRTVGWVITFIVGFVIKVICYNVGLWIVDGFVDDKGKQD